MLRGGYLSADYLDVSLCKLPFSFGGGTGVILSFYEMECMKKKIVLFLFKRGEFRNGLCGWSEEVDSLPNKISIKPPVKL